MAEKVNLNCVVEAEVGTAIDNHWKAHGHRSRSAYILKLIRRDMASEGQQARSADEPAASTDSVPAIVTALRKEFAALVFVIAATEGRSDIAGSSEKALKMVERYLRGDFQIEEG